MLKSEVPGPSLIEIEALFVPAGLKTAPGFAGTTLPVLLLIVPQYSLLFAGAEPPFPLSLITFIIPLIVVSEPSFTYPFGQGILIRSICPLLNGY